MNLLIPQLVALASGAGFQGDDLVTAVAVALAESGGNPQAYNPEKRAGAAQGYGSFGLWQIYRSAHPEFEGQNLFDPQTNAAAAFSVYRGAGNSFHPWSTFKSGAYLAHTDAVLQVVNASQDVVATDGTADPTADPTLTTDVIPPDGSGPSSGGILGLVIGGGILFWAVTKIFNG